MIQINKNYIDRFTRTRNSYLYPIIKGIYLAFDINDLSYIGVEMYYQPKYNIQKYADEKLNKLISLSYVDII